MREAHFNIYNYATWWHGSSNKLLFQIIGAYCSTEWSERKHTDKSMGYFGTGESFLFRLSPNQAKFSWVGIHDRDNIPNSAHFFMSGDNTRISIGGG